MERACRRLSYTTSTDSRSATDVQINTTTTARLQLRALRLGGATAFVDSTIPA
jgi:hypothetical protein